MKHVIFWGATGQAKVLREALPASIALVALFDNRAIPSPFSDIPISYGEHGLNAWESARPHGPSFACVTIGGTRGKDRLELMRWLAGRGHSPLTVVHPRAFVARDVSLGNGCQILALAAICTGGKLGDGVIINTAASVDHDCSIGHGVHIAPGATLAGEVVVEDLAFIGAGATVLPRMRIGTGAIVGAGAVVTREVPAGAIVVGNPAKSPPPKIQ